MHQDMVEILLRSPLLAGVDPTIRNDLALRFECRPFTAGQTLIRAGAEGRDLLEILAGTAEVFVVDEDQRYRVAVLEPGSIAGEGAFFDAQAVRKADVVGSSEGIVAVLPWAAYRSLADDEHPGATALERTVMHMVSHRLQETNARLSALLVAQRSGGLRVALGRMFGKPTPAPGVTDG